MTVAASVTGWERTAASPCGKSILSAVNFEVSRRKSRLYTRSDVLVRGVVRRRRAFRGSRTSSKEFGRNVHAHSFRFTRTSFILPVSQKTHIGTNFKRPSVRLSSVLGTVGKLGLTMVWPNNFLSCLPAHLNGRRVNVNARLVWLNALTI